MKTTTRDSLAEMFPGDRLIPEMASACERDPVAYGVYMKCHRWRLLWEHPKGSSKHLRAYLKNPVWPAKALKLCYERRVPAPTWVMQWASVLVARASTAKNQSAAKSVDKAFHEIAEAMYTTPMPAVRILDEAAAPLNPVDAARLRTALLEVNDRIGIPKAKKARVKTGKR